MHASFVPPVGASCATVKKACVVTIRKQTGKQLRMACCAFRAPIWPQAQNLHLGEWNVSFLNGRGQMGRCPPYRNHRTTGCSSLGRRCFPSMTQSSRPSMTQSSGSILSRLVIGRS